MNPDSPAPDPQLSDLGRAMLGSGANRPGTKPSAAWVPPTAEELQQELPQYEIAKMLGRGGMGAVYMGRQTSLDRAVAIKILSGALEESDAGFTERFKNEARAMAKLNHPGIVSVYDFGQTASGLLYIVMEYVDGTDVAKMIVASGRLHSEHAMAIAAHVCDALSYAHERGIIHRDIKPANIMVAYDGSVKVADFGLAKVSTANGSTMGLTQSGMALGTLHYMAPEALILGTAVDHRADIYAVGVMLYQMLTGKLPQGMFKMPSQIVPGIDPRYDGVIAKAIMEDRDERYPGVRDLRGALDTIVTQPVAKVDERAKPALPTQARPQRPGARPPQPSRSNPAAATPAPKGFPFGLAALLLLMLAGVVWFFFFKPQEPKAPNVAVESAPTVTTASIVTPQPIAQIRILTPDAVRVLKLEKGQPRLYDSNPLRVIEGIAAGLQGWQFTSIPQRIDNEYTIRVEKPGVIYAFGAFHKGTTPLDSLGSDAARWVDAEGDITGAMVKFCYKRNVSAGETLKFKAFELQFAAPSMTLEITPAPTAAPAVTSPPAPQSSTPSDTGGWTSLFNGKDLTGWEANPPNFPAKVIGGQLKIEGVAVREDAGHLFYVGDGSLAGKLPVWKNFELIATLKTLRMGNSGLRIHSRPASREFNINATGPEINIWNEGMTTPVDKDHRTGGIPRMAVVPVSYFKDGEWFEMKIRVQNDTHLQVWVRREGATTWTTTVDWTQPANWTPPPYHPNARLSSGTIAFTNWVPADGEVWVREVKIRSLDASPAPAMPATEATPSVATLQETFGGHRYQFVPGSTSWAEAKTKAEALGGHLVTITSKEENDFLLKTYGDKLPDVNRNIWLGAIEDRVGAGWKWVTGEPFTFTGWVLNEPNGIKGGGGEVGPPFMLNFYRFREGVGWNDSSTHSSQTRDNVGFIVEWEDAAPLTDGSLKLESLLGLWNATSSSGWKGTYEFKSDGTLIVSGNVTRSWRIAGGAVTWFEAGNHARMVLEGEQKLTGSTGQGYKSTAIKVSTAAAADKPAPQASPTLWIDTKGRSLQAKFIRLEGSNVLLDISGRTTPVALATLSPASQQIARELQASITIPTEVPEWLIGQWHQTNDGKAQPIYLLELKPDRTTSFAGGNLRTTGHWSFEDQVLKVSWANGARYEVQVPANRPSNDLSGIIYDIDGRPGHRNSVRIQKIVEAASDSWTTLFPGDSLSGWTGDTSAYRVSGGVLTGSGRGDLISPKEYSNFELKFDLRISDEANSGIGIWRDAVTGTTATASHGFEVQIQDDTASKYSKQEFWQRHGGIYYFKPPLSLAMTPPGTWNTHEIRVEGTQVKVSINGKLVQDADVTQLKPQASRAPVLDVSRRRGHLLIMGRVGTAEFRNLQIRELP